MADPEALKLLETGQKNLKKCDFSGYDARGKSFAQIDFRGCNLKHANFTSCYFVDCDFTGAKLQGANLSKTSLNNCHFDSNISNVNFDYAVFNGGTNKSLIFDCTFRGAKFFHVNVQGITYGKGNNFKNAINITDFSGETVPPMNFEHGHLSPDYMNLLPFEERAPLEDDETDIPVQARSEFDATSIKVKENLQTGSKNAHLMSVSLSASIADFINDAPIPNEPEKHEFHENYISLLKEIKDGLELITDALDTHNSSNTTADLDTATKSIMGLRTLIEEWWDQNSSKALDYGARVGLLGAGTAFLTFCGAPPSMAAGICALLAGSKEVANYIKEKTKTD